MLQFWIVLVCLLLLLIFGQEAYVFWAIEVCRRILRQASISSAHVFVVRIEEFVSIEELFIECITLFVRSAIFIKSAATFEIIN